MASSNSWICTLLIALCLASSAAGWRRQLTTRAWDVLGFSENVPHSPNEDQIIVAVLDSGIWPESQSFDDKGLGPPPAKWKGTCDPGNSSIPFKCNNKIIGARFYIPPWLNSPQNPNEDISPRDTDGHGTHVAATLAGVPVKKVSMEGIGLGTARGAVPRARIAVYKVCFGQCYTPSVSAGIIDAIKDGADFISISIAAPPYPFEIDGTSYATFAAMRQGIFVTRSAGNNDTLNSFTVNGVQPWETSVGNGAGAGTDYVTYVRTGDGKQYEGAHICPVDHGKTMYPLINYQEVSNATNPKYAGICVPKFMNPEAVKGKIVLCDGYVANNGKEFVNFDALGIAALIYPATTVKYAFDKESFHLRPNSKTPIIGLKDHDFKSLITYYLDSNKTGQTATLNVAKTIIAADTPPRSAAASARGPNLLDMNILKPDLSAPGVNLIAAVNGDNPAYNAMSGTSMSAPFVSGIAAYVKSFHPTWSPAAIKSALMTTATPMYDPYKNASELAYGTGQVDPLRATDPGLVYDIEEKDYVKYLCQYANGSSEVVYNVTKNATDDCAKIPIENNWQLNYPAFTVPAFTDKPFVKVFQRTVTHVGNSSASNYKAVVSAPKTLTVKVEPSVLAFTQMGQALSYTLTVEGILPYRNTTDVENVISAYLVWTDGSHQVRSPIVVFERPVDMIEKTVKTVGAVW